jgi:hypothetical protein
MEKSKRIRKPAASPGKDKVPRGPVPLSEAFNFISGYVQEAAVLRVVAQANVLALARTPNSTLMKFVRPEGKRYDFHLSWTVVALCVLRDPLQVLYADASGRVNVGDTRGERTEHISGSGNGTKVHGEIRGLRVVENAIYAFGMGRQVYRRQGENNWVHHDEGALSAPSLQDVVGFNALDGTTERDIHAVGFAGELWHLDGFAWHRFESPTKQILNSVRAVAPSVAYACGNAGTLVRFDGNTWRPVVLPLKQNLWSVEWFAGKLYVAADDGLFVIGDEGVVEAIDLGVVGFTSGSLHANHGVLLSVGRRHAFWTDDGRRWHDLTQPNP